MIPVKYQYIQLYFITTRVLSLTLKGLYKGSPYTPNIMIPSHSTKVLEREPGANSTTPKEVPASIPYILLHMLAIYIYIYALKLYEFFFNFFMVHLFICFHTYKNLQSIFFRFFKGVLGVAISCESVGFIQKKVDN